MSNISKTDKKIPSVIKAVGFTSCFMNISTLIIFSYFAIYLKDVLHLNLSQLGFLDGIIESISYVMKLFSGYISDFIGNKKTVFLAGSILLLISKPLESIYTTLLPLFCARLLERIGNGLQATPRDALICDWSSNDNKNACFGFRNTMGTIGSLLGALLASCLYYCFRNFQRVFLFSCIPSAIAVFIIIFHVKNQYCISNNNAITPPLQY